MYFLQVGVGLIDGTDEHGCGLDVLFLLLLFLGCGEVAADVHAFYFGEDDPAQSVELFDHLLEELSTLPCHLDIIQHQGNTLRPN